MQSLLTSHDATTGVAAIHRVGEGIGMWPDLMSLLTSLPPPGETAILKDPDEEMLS
jgi:hypothetical protein